jgi:hypothetical protein
MGLLIFPLLFSACKPGTPTQDPAVIKTQAAQTVESVLSMTAMAVTPSSTATPTNTLAATTELQITETPRPTNTPLITDTPAVTNTPFINPTPAFTLPYSCDQFTFIDDITIPDGATVQPGATFVKTWRIQNSGSCVWTTGYQLVFGYGGEGTNWSKIAPVNFPNDVAQGGLMDISVTLTAPTIAGTYNAFFRPRNDKGTTFGEFIWLYITVP